MRGVTGGSARFGAFAAAGGLALVPAAVSAPACPAPPPSAALTAVAVPQAARPVVRVPAARPRCATLARLPVSGIRVDARPGGIVVLRVPGRAAVRIPARGRRVVVAADAARDRLVVAWGGSRRTIRARVSAETRVLVRGTRVTVGASPAGAGPSETAPAAPGASPPRAPTPATPPVPVPVARPDALFAPGGPWNQRIDTAEIAPDSAEVAADLRAQALDTGTWMNTDRWSVPIYVVGPGVPRVTVRDNDDGEMNLPGPWRWGTVPLPAGAVAAGPHPDGDNHLVVWQPSSDTMWEFWRFRRAAAGPEAPHGARIEGVSRSNGSIPSPYGATASGIALAAGMVTARDIAAGSIDHALVIGIPEIRAGSVVAPATRTDGYVDRASAPAMGSRFRLDPTVDVAALGLPPLTRMVALAAQRYGLIVRDRSGSVTFYGEDPVATGADPFTAALGGGEMGEVMRTFPWQHIQLVRPGG